MAQNHKIVEDRGIRNVLYIGDDDHYWNSVKRGYETTYANRNFLYYHYRHTDGVSYKEIFHKMLKLKPHIIYVDLSKDMPHMLKLARMITRENIFKTSATNCLVNDREYIWEARNTGVDFVHIKCGEMHDVIFGSVRLVFPKIVVEPSFARALFESKKELFIPLRVGYYGSDHTHFESDVLLSKDKEYRVSTEIPKTSLPSKLYKLKEMTAKDGCYYNHRYSFDLTPVFYDKPQILVDSEKDKRRGKKSNVDAATIKAAWAEYEVEHEFAKKNFQKWVVENIEDDFE